jgi:CubicO group peptidase (beta-lactamase class C family)
LISGCSEKKEPVDRLTKQFTSEIMELREYFKIPGLAVSIDKDGEIIYKDYFGFSDIVKSTELDSTTLFPIASITKVFSGVLIMKLVEQEKLFLDEPINKFLPKPILDD